MTHRPKYPKTDSNHTMVAEVLRKLDYQYMGTTFHLIDTSKVGGNLVDWQLIANGVTYYVEVKTPEERDSLTEGEKETQSWGVPFYVVTSPEEVMDMLYDIAEEITDG